MKLATNQVLTNQIGYGCDDYKKAVFQGNENSDAGKFRVIDAETKNIEFSGTAVKSGTVARWNSGYYWTLDFSPLKKQGQYTIELDTAGGIACSFPFEIQKDLISIRMISGVCFFLKGQRSTGEWCDLDKHISFKGNREGVVDVHGGWYDATGDVGVHMTHQSHTTYFNPQQVSLTACTLFRLLDLLEESGNEQYSMQKRRVLDEAMFGADFLMRMRAPSGTFFRTVDRDNALKCVSENRKMGFEYHNSSSQFGIAETADKEIVTDSYYEVGFRSGAGFSIAALAAAARHSYPGTDYSGYEYMKAAKDAYSYLEENNGQYVNDGKWNLVDEYCALEAINELYKTTNEYDYLRRAREMADRIMARAVDHGDGTAAMSIVEGRLFFHATDEGAPVVALLNYVSIEPDEARRKQTVAVCEKIMRNALNVTGEVNNPFGYARYLFSEKDGEKKTGFFFPHNTEASPWWQGDNARIASLSCAAKYLSYNTEDADLRVDLEKYAEDQLNWIMGLNPYDSCMIEAYGRNNIQYFFQNKFEFINAPGGICNGMTGRIDDEDSIDYISEPCEAVDDNWRWAEQWLPHESWYLYAMAMKKR
jgi:hypothetical protein